MTRGTKQYLRNKFFQALPQIRDEFPHVAALFDEAKNSTGGNKKAEELKIIQNCFSNTEGGCHWTLDLAKPCFKEAKTRYTCYSNMEAYALGSSLYVQFSVYA